MGSPDLGARLAALDLTLGRNLVPCFDTAAAIHGFDLSGDERLHLITDKDTTSKRSELVMHRLVPRNELTTVRGQLVMEAAETAVRVAARLPSSGNALAVLDAALRSEAVPDVGALADIASRLRIRGIPQVRRVVPFATPLAESPRESLLRWLFLEADLPPPTPQFWVDAPFGRSYRIDLAWPQYKVGCEYDGVAVHTGEALYRDRDRLNDLHGIGWTMLFVTSRMVGPEQRRLVQRVTSVLRDRGAQI